MMALARAFRHVYSSNCSCDLVQPSNFGLRPGGDGPQSAIVCMAAQSRSLARGEQEFALAEVPAGACDDTSSDEADSEGVVEGEEEEEPWRAERSRAEPRALAKSGKEHDVATCKAEKDSSQTQLSVPTVGCLAHIASGPCRVRDAGPYLDLEDDEDEGASSASSSTNSPARGEVGEDFREEQRAEEQNVSSAPCPWPLTPLASAFGTNFCGRFLAHVSN